MAAAARKQGEPAPLDVAGRTVSATLGAYALAYALTAATAGVMFRLGAPRVDAAIVSSSLGLLVFPAVSIWAFAERRPAVAAGAPFAAALILGAVAWTLRL